VGLAEELTVAVKVGPKKATATGTAFLMGLCLATDESAKAPSGTPPRLPSLRHSQIPTNGRLNLEITDYWLQVLI
jgi:hypothetical protein